MVAARRWQCGSDSWDPSTSGMIRATRWVSRRGRSRPCWRKTSSAACRQPSVRRRRGHAPGAAGDTVPAGTGYQVSAQGP